MKSLKCQPYPGLQGGGAVAAHNGGHIGLPLDGLVLEYFHTQRVQLQFHLALFCPEHLDC